MVVIDFEVSLRNWLEDGKENQEFQEFKNKVEIVMTLEYVSNTECRRHDI
jgi:hypothetical protein